MDLRLTSSLMLESSVGAAVSAPDTDAGPPMVVPADDVPPSPPSVPALSSSGRLPPTHQGAGGASRTDRQVQLNAVLPLFLNLRNLDRLQHSFASPMHVWVNCVLGYGQLVACRAE